MELVFNTKSTYMCELHTILAFIKKLRFNIGYFCHVIKESPV